GGTPEREVLNDEAQARASETRLPPPARERTAPPTRRQLAALLIAPEHERFAQVIVNRIWKRYMGRGLVEPADDWANAEPSPPRVLRYLARELLPSGYALKRVARLTLSSHAYQRRAPAPPPAERTPRDRLFAGPYRRRMSAEQLVDSLFRATGKQFR